MFLACAISNTLAVSERLADVFDRRGFTNQRNDAFMKIGHL